MTVAPSAAICPANVWNHTSGCTCTSNGSITAEAAHVDLLAGTAYDTRPPFMQMNEDEFDQMFGGTVESPDGVAMWTSHPTEHDPTIAKDRIWTVVENGENENLYLLPGDHKVNHLAWVVTEEAWGNPNIEVLWHDETEMDDYEERVAAQSVPDTEPIPTAVFGPDRPAAAASAIHEYNVAKAEREASPFDDTAFERLRRATESRVLYSEYGDDFTHH
jgi:hypothetical protein